MPPYRLGDVVWTLVSPTTYWCDLTYHNEFANSLAQHVMTAAGQGTNKIISLRPHPFVAPLVALAEAVHARAPPPDQIPTFIVHLRTGDALRYWRSGREAFYDESNHCVPSMRDLESVVAECRQREIKKVSLIATMHRATLYGGTAEHTKEYVGLCEQFLADHGLTVTVTVAASGDYRSADADFVTYCTAPYLMLSGGGYAALVWATRALMGAGICTLAPKRGANSVWWDVADACVKQLRGKDTSP
jgi:hypothetical protein